MEITNEWLQEYVYELLDRVKSTPLRGPSWEPTQKNIFQGCYDVWATEQDRLDAQHIPGRRLAELREMGLIVSGPGKWKADIWTLTEAGEAYHAAYRAAGLAT